MTMTVTYQTTMSKFSLMSYLFAKGCVKFTLPCGQEGYITTIQREDGSGSSFNIRVETPLGPVAVYVRCTD